MGTVGTDVDWHEIAAKAQNNVLQSIPNEWRLSPEFIPNSKSANVSEIPRTCGILSPKEIEITEQTASQLVKKLSIGRLKSVEVTRAFCVRAALVHQLVRFTGGLAHRQSLTERIRRIALQLSSPRRR
jgi:amidase